jgi:amino acid transporter
MTVSPTGLARKSIGFAGLTFVGISAAAPLTGLAGGGVAAFAATGVVGVPLGFAILTVPLLLISVGVVALSKDVSHAAAFYAFLARGLGRSAGVAGAGVALVAYNAIQIGLYGLFGATASGIAGGIWWIWALAAWAVVGTLGVRHVEVNIRVIAAVVLAEIVIIGLFIIAALGHPAADAAGVLTPLAPAMLLVPGLGGVLALGIAAFVGFESIVVYREEANAHSSVRRASFVALAFLGILLTLGTWGMAVAVGPSSVIDVARDPGSDLPLSVLGSYYGPLVAVVGRVILLLSMFGAMMAFHNVVSRYVFALSRERVLPGSWSITGGTRGGVPIGGSVVQSVIAVVTICVFAAVGADPFATVFTMLSTLGALGIMVLLIAAAAAVIRFSLRSAHRPVPWRPLYASAIGGSILTVVLLTTVFNLSSVTGDAAGSLHWILPVLIVLVGWLGAAWGGFLRRSRPGVWATIGRGQPKPLAVLDQALAHLEL